MDETDKYPAELIGILDQYYEGESPGSVASNFPPDTIRAILYNWLFQEVEWLCEANNEQDERDAINSLKIMYKRLKQANEELEKL